jgi:hypothetical protein
MDFHQSNKLFFFPPVLFEMHCNDAQYTVTFQYIVGFLLFFKANYKCEILNHFAFGINYSQKYFYTTYLFTIHLFCFYITRKLL